MPLWAKLYWIVAVVLFCVWIWRRMNARGSNAQGSTAQASKATTSGVGATTTGGVESAAGPAIAASDQSAAVYEGDLGARAWPAPPPPDPNDTSYRLDPAADVATDGEGASEPGESAGEMPGRSVFDTAGPRSTLPELLAGITLPHELVPLTQIDTAIDLATHVVVATQKAAADVVTQGLTAELERLGYEVERPTMTELEASGDRGSLRVVIHPDGTNVHDAGLRRFPTAEEHMVVVELFAR